MSHALVLFLCAAAPDAGVELKAAMQHNLAALVALQPLIASPAAFRDPKNAATVSSGLAALARVPHRIAAAKGAPPAMAVAGLFGEAVERAQGDFKAGRVDTARVRVRGLTTLCASCHARQLAQGDFLAGPGVSAAGLEPLERAQFLAATRQFDAALAVWAEALLAPRVTDDDTFVLQQALRSAVGVSVRAKDDAAGTVRLIASQRERTDLTPNVRRTLEAWLADAKQWQAEGFVAAERSADELFGRAQQLIIASRAADNMMVLESARVPLLRATAYLGLALEREPRAKWRGEALWLLAVATSAANDPDLWDLDALYLEACIKENARTPLAVRCADRLAERTVLEFTGSGGTRIPADVAQRLAAMRAMAGR